MMRLSCLDALSRWTVRTASHVLIAYSSHQLVQSCHGHPTILQNSFNILCCSVFPCLPAAMFFLRDHDEMCTLRRELGSIALPPSR